jgi:peptidyl-dipeptidase Dcp
MSTEKQTASAENPLLALSPLPNHAPRFELIEEAHFLPAVEAAIAEARANIEKIKACADAPDFGNTILALETSAERLGDVTSIFYNQLSANGTDELQALVEKIGPLCANFSNDMAHDAALFARVKEVHDRDDRSHLTPEQQMLLDDTYIGFVRGGALLDEEKKKRLREISERASVLGPTYTNNVKKSTEDFELLLDKKDDLSGLPDSAIEMAAHAAQEKGLEGKWLFTLDIPSYMPFLQFSDKRELREKMWRAFGGRATSGPFDNHANVLEIVRLRHERAQLLGYASHAHYVLERRMAETPQTVLDFLDQLKDSYKQAALKDLAALKEFAAAENGPEEIQPWDIAYYSEKLKKKLFDISSEDFRPYLPLDNVLNGVFAHFSKLFHLRFKPSDQYELWHRDVKAYDVFDLTGGDFMGTLFADFHPREGKKDGAWKTTYRNQGLYNGRIERPVVAIVCNFTKPTDKRPSLLTHDEVTTLFHEMGHAIHALLSRVTYQSLAGTSVLWDFVELPSQIQENWAYTRETLDMFAAHYETGEKIPEEMVRKLWNARNFMVGWGGLRQVNFARLDMAWHATDPARIGDNVGAFEDETCRDSTLFPRQAGPVSCSFNHIFSGGYSAGYYSYKWAEVLDADAFELFEERGLYDQPTAEAFKNEILSRGGSEHPRILYRRFRGRDADPEALLRREGLARKAAA